MPSALTYPRHLRRGNPQRRTDDHRRQHLERRPCRLLPARPHQHRGAITSYAEFERVFGGLSR